MSERDRRLDALLARALDATPKEREAILGEAGELRAELEAMLALGAGMDGGFLETSAGDRLRRSALEAGERVGQFTVRAPIARGGSGTVYEAEQDQPKRDVALKVMGHVGLSERAQSRFLAEAETLAKLVHPGIAHVYEAGVHDGLPYIAMELVRGAEALTQHAAALSRAARLALFASVCDAVHFGHVRGIVHGDIKPANVLVRNGHAKVVDYGIAEAEGTLREVVAGTPAYMPPEQLDPDAPLDARSDVYSLGVVLGELAMTAPPDLTAIVTRATAAEPASRYASAAALADDVRRFLRREPVTARPAGWWHHVALFARRRTAVAVLLAALGIALVGGTAISTRFAIDADVARREAERQAYLGTLSAAAFALRLYDVREARAQLERSPPDLRGWEWRHLKAQVRDPSRVFAASGAGLHMGAVARAAPVVADTSSSRLNVRVRNLDTGAIVHEIPRQGRLRYTCALAPDGLTLYTGDDDGIIEARRLPLGDVLWSARLGTSRIWKIVVSADGSLVCACSVAGPVRVMRSGGAVLHTLEHAGAAYAADFAPDGRRLYTGGRSARDVRAWDLVSGAELWRATGHEHNVESLSVSPDGRTLASGSLDSTVRLWSTANGSARAVFRGHTKAVKCVAVHPSRPWVASGSIDTTIRVWDMRTGREVLRLLGHEWQVRSVAWLADGRRLVSQGREGSVHIWDVERRALTPELQGISPGVAHLLFRDDATLAMASITGQIAHADLRTLAVAPEPAVAAAHGVLLDESGILRAFAGGEITQTAFEGSRVVLGGAPEAAPLRLGRTPDGAVVGDVRGYVTQLGSTPVSWRAHERPIAAVAACGNLIATAPLDGPVTLWRGTVQAVATESGQKPRALLHDAVGERLFVGQADGTLEVLSLPGGHLLARYGGHTGPVVGLALSPDRTRLASASSDGTVRIWHLRWGVSLLTLQGHAISVLSVAWSPDGTRLASGGGGGVPEADNIRIWEAPEDH